MEAVGQDVLEVGNGFRSEGLEAHPSHHQSADMSDSEQIRRNNVSM